MRLCGSSAAVNSVFAALAAAAAYGVCLGFGFLNYDDCNLVLANEFINGSRACSLADFFVPGLVRDDVYMPLTLALYSFLIRAFGKAPLAFHAVSLCFYAASSAALCMFLSESLRLVSGNAALRRMERLFGSGSVAFWAAMLYAVHPAHAENVAWIAALGYNAAALFFFSALLVFVRLMYRFDWGGFSLMCLLFSVSVLFQPAAVVFPALLLVWAFVFKRECIAFCAKLSSVPFAIAGLYMILFRMTISSSGRLGGFSLGLLERVSVFGRFVLNSFLPFDLQPIYPVHGPLYAVLAVVAVAAVVFAIVRTGDRIVSFSCLWFLVAMSPFLNVFFCQPPYDRYLMMSSAGPCLLVSYGLLAVSALLARKVRAFVRIALFPVVSFFALFLVLAFIQALFWSSDVALWGRAWERYRPNGLVYSCYGGFCLVNGRYEDLYEASDFVLAADPANREAYRLKLSGLLEEGRIGDLYETCKREIEIEPGYFLPYLYMADVDLGRGELDRALEEAEKAVELSAGESAVPPGMKRLLSEICRRKGESLLKSGDREGAGEFLRRARSLDPSNDAAAKALSDIEGKPGSASGHAE